YGAVEDAEALAGAAKNSPAVVIGSYDAIALGVLRPPGECGVDVAVGEGQPLGNRLDFGGPSFGWFAATEAYLRRMPGRIAGQTRHTQPVVREFAVRLDAQVERVVERCRQQGINPGLPLEDDGLLVALTERRTRADIDRLVEVVGAAVAAERQAVHA